MAISERLYYTGGVGLLASSDRSFRTNLKLLALHARPRSPEASQDPITLCSNTKLIYSSAAKSINIISYMAADIPPVTLVLLSVLEDPSRTSLTRLMYYSSLAERIRPPLVMCALL